MKPRIPRLIVVNKDVSWFLFAATIGLVVTGYIMTFLVSDNALSLSYDEFMALPMVIRLSDFHCVTGWTKFDNKWEGVSFQAIKEMVKPLDKLMEDIQKGKEVSIKKLKKVSNEAMDEEIPLWGGTKLRKEGLFAYIGEVYHHKGQVTYIRGTYKRLNE